MVGKIPTFSVGSGAKPENEYKYPTTSSHLHSSRASPTVNILLTKTYIFSPNSINPCPQLPYFLNKREPIRGARLAISETIPFPT